MTKKILVQACCAPCATYTFQWLKQEGWEATAYYYNPNIYDEFEFIKRYAILKEYAGKADLPLVFDFDNHRLTPGKCKTCYEIRLLKTALYAKQEGYDAFSTTLLISPYQNHELIKEIAEHTAKQEGIEFFYRDFRDGYQESRILSNEYGLYMQKHCGCEKSLQESQARRVKHEPVAAVVN